MSFSPSTATAESKPDCIMDDRCYINHPPKRTAYEWHLNDKYDSALKKAERFRLKYKQQYDTRHWLFTFLLRTSTTIKDSVYAIQKGYLDDIDMRYSSDIWKEIIEDFKTASETNDPTYVLTAYSRLQPLTRRINGDMAKNTYHEFTLYCTSLNCNVLARTQDGIQAFITILFHPKLDKYLCIGDMTVYRGAVIDNESVLEGYGKGSIIVTTTLLSTSKRREVAERFAIPDPDSTMANQISFLCVYKIHNYRRTALEMKKVSVYQYEDEVLIYPYVPFRIQSFERTIIEVNGKARIEVHLEEIGDNENGNSELQSVRAVSTNR